MVRTPRCRPHLDPVSVNGHPTIVSNKIYALGEFIELYTNVYIDHNLWEALFHSQKGRSNYRKYLWHLRHKSAPLIARYTKHGLPVLLHYSPWTL